jgi:hypothetical protein
MKTKSGFILLPLALLLSGCLGGSKTPTAPTQSPSPAPSSSATPTSSPSSMPTGDADVFTGPDATAEAEYALPPSIDNDVLAGQTTQQTQVKGVIFRPATLPSTPSPVIIVLHGNHSTCGTNTSPIVEDGCAYTFSGSCTGSDVEIPSYHGYDYLATRLASFGYVVVSIDANLGITCGNGTTADEGLVLARGRLILRTLADLSSWNKNPGTTPSSLGVDLAGHLDFTQVGLFGHSRGGEGVRAAYNLYKSDPNVSSPWTSQILSPVTFRGIFEVGPVDGMSTMTLNANGAAWNVILPGCDGDVEDMEGMKPYDRMLQDTTENPALPKSMYEVWGANHDFYNTEWQSSDSTGCTGTTPLWALGASSSTNEQETAIGSVIPFFRAHVGTSADPTLAASFDPTYPLIPEVAAITRVDRTYTASSNSNDTTHVETFPNGTTKGSLGQAFGTGNLTSFVVGTVPEHDPTLQAAEIVWSSSGVDTYFQDNWTAVPQGLNLAGNASLNFRVSRNSSMASAAATDFSIQLVFSDGSLGNTVDLASYFNLIGPLASAGTTLSPPSSSDMNVYHETLPTVIIPLTALGVNGRQVSGVRFTFSGTSSGDIFISSIDLASTASGSIASTQPAQTNPVIEARSEEATSQARVAQVVKPINRLSRVQKSEDNSGDVLVEIQSDTNFPVRDALPVLKLNGKIVAFGLYDTSGDLHSMSFRVSSASLAGLPEQVQMDVGYKQDPDGAVRSVGMVQTATLQQ